MACDICNGIREFQFYGNRNSYADETVCPTYEYGDMMSLKKHGVKNYDSLRIKRKYRKIS